MRCAKSGLWIAPALVLGLAVACAPTTKRIEIDPKLAEAEAEKQRELFLTEVRKDQRRIWSVSYPLLVKAASLCKDEVEPRLGLYAKNLYSYPMAFRKTAKRMYGAGEDLRVVFVAPDSAAPRAGFKEGDRLVSIGGEEIPAGSRAPGEWRELVVKHANKGEFDVVVRRQGAHLTLTAKGETGCKYPVGLSPRPEVNAMADGKRVVVTRGMVRFAEKDSELATVIGHEMAHNAMGHMDAKIGNFLFGTLFDILAAGFGVNTQGAFGRMSSLAYSQSFEGEADYVGLYMTVLAGYEIENAPNFWRRMGVMHPGSIRTNFSATHPSAPERFVALEQSVKEIRAKQAQGLPLVPDMKKKTAAEPAETGSPEGN